MNATLTFLKYKNYYDRRLDFSNIYGSVADYTGKFESKGMGPRVLDFDFGDGMTTKQFVKGFDSDDGFFAYNYLLVDTGTEGLVSSRWYVTEAKYVRGGGYWVSLRRDVLADYFNTVRKSTVLVTKGMLKDSSPLVFNREGVSYNQIKKEEIPLKDALGYPWVVGYIPRDFASDADKTIEVDYTTMVPDIEFATQADMESADWYGYLGIAQYKHEDVCVGYKTTIDYQSTDPRVEFEHFDEEGWIDDYDPQNIPGYKCYKRPDGRTITVQSAVTTSKNQSYPIEQVASQFIGNKVFADAKTAIVAKYPTAGFDKATAVRGKVVHVKNPDKFYIIAYEENGPEYVDDSATSLKTVSPSFFTNTQSAIEHVILSQNPLIRMEYSGDDAVVSRKQSSIKITLEELNLKAKVTIPKKRQHLLDSSLYDMFAMPANIGSPVAVKALIGATPKIIYQDGYMSLAVASKVTADAGSGAVYDVQWLPYCPVRENIEYLPPLGNGRFNATLDNCVPITNAEGTVIGYMAFASKSNFSFNITNIAIPEYGKMQSRKESNELETWRMCSPNYNGIFEFSPSKNNGVNGFHVDCTYKPFQPYIRVAPVFKSTGLYGGAYNDKRGLILGGDFSLPRLTTEWANYIQNNKNYQASFDRQIESMDLRHKIGMTEAVMGSIAGTIQGGAQGAQAGASIGGGPIGAIVGGVVGTAAAAAGGIADVMNTKALYNDEVDRTKKLFQYSLQNIQAIPSSISKASGFDLNVKPFPFIEYYCPTQTEIDAFRNMIKWNGMTVGVVGTMEEYFPESLDDLGTTYFEASVIRLADGFTGDFHEADAIAYELRRGIYI